MTRRKREKLILDHIGLVKSIAIRVHENLPVHVDLDDLISAGVFGLMEAVGKFDEQMGCTIATYAKHRIKGAILDSLRERDWLSRDMRRRQKQFEAVTHELAVALMRRPTDEEIAEKFGVDVDRWRMMMLDLLNVGLVSASTRSDPDDDLPPRDFAGKASDRPDEMCIVSETHDILVRAVETLPPRYQKVIWLYYESGIPMRAIGLVLGVNESRISSIRKTALAKLRQHFNDGNLTFAAFA